MDAVNHADRHPHREPDANPDDYANTDGHAYAHSDADADSCHPRRRHRQRRLRGPRRRWCTDRLAARWRLPVGCNVARAQRYWRGATGEHHCVDEVAVPDGSGDAAEYVRIRCVGSGRRIRMSPRRSSASPGTHPMTAAETLWAVPTAAAPLDAADPAYRVLTTGAIAAPPAAQRRATSRPARAGLRRARRHLRRRCIVSPSPPDTAAPTTTPGRVQRRTSVLTDTSERQRHPISRAACGRRTERRRTRRHQRGALQSEHDGPRHRRRVGRVVQRGRDE